eukprot:TRINITY_DN38159_c0_g2_i3.p2 TRINITY_DN38159_c0_g2~~TRINITY_DN38159_c0_g2_i3.p2  ORF type:complete len:101 (-),score=8.17 TRINITY_DN38159_c0_g2_i3:466-768(-)
MHVFHPESISAQALVAYVEELDKASWDHLKKRIATGLQPPTRDSFFLVPNLRGSRADREARRHLDLGPTEGHLVCEMGLEPRPSSYMSSRSVPPALPGCL